MEFVEYNNHRYFYVEVQVNGVFEKKISVTSLPNSGKIIYVDSIEELATLNVKVGHVWRECGDCCEWRVLHTPEDMSMFINPHTGSSIVDRSDNVTFCPTCGRKIIQIEEQ